MVIKIEEKFKSPILDWSIEISEWKERFISWIDKIGISNKIYWK